LRSAAFLAAVVAACAACGGSSAAGRITEAKPPVAKHLLTARLRAKGLDFKWVACVRTGRSFRGVAVVRCNVNFGDPHIEAYCSVLRDGKLLTDHENGAIPCRHDDAGPGPTIVHS
jgi:hypothetical protein